MRKNIALFVFWTFLAASSYGAPKKVAKIIVTEEGCSAESCDPEWQASVNQDGSVSIRSPDGAVNIAPFQRPGTYVINWERREEENHMLIEYFPNQPNNNVRTTAAQDDDSTFTADERNELLEVANLAEQHAVEVESNANIEGWTDIAANLRGIADRLRELAAQDNPEPLNILRTLQEAMRAASLFERDRQAMQNARQFEEEAINIMAEAAQAIANGGNATEANQRAAQQLQELRDRRLDPSGRGGFGGSASQ